MGNDRTNELRISPHVADLDRTDIGILRLLQNNARLCEGDRG
jgi:hypothetical protein